MPSYALLRTYQDGLRARITPRDGAFVLELFDRRGQRCPDLPVIVPSLEEAQQLADDHADSGRAGPWLPVYRGTFEIVRPDEF